MEVGLSSAVHVTLGAIQQIASQTEQNQLRISTGQEHQGLGDNPFSVSIAKSLSNRASDLLVVKDTISQGVSKVETATMGLGFIQDILNELKASCHNKNGRYQLFPVNISSGTGGA